MIDPIIEGRADYVSGSRYLPGGDSPNLPWFRRDTIPMVTIYTSLLMGTKLSDGTCGYRAFKLDIMHHAQFDWHAEWLYTYAFEYYLFAKVILDGTLRWFEVPVTMHYPEVKRNYSKIRPGKDWWAMLKPWISARINRQGFAPPAADAIASRPR